MAKIGGVLLGLIHVFFAWANPVEDHAKHVVNEYMDYSLVLIQNTVGFSAPVSARMYAYVTVGAHEAAVDFSPDLISLEGKLANYVRPQFSFTSENCALPVVLNEVYFQLFTYMFRGAPPYYLKELSLLHSSLDDSSTKTFSKRVRKRSKLYGQTIAQHIIEWSKRDSGDDAYLQNYPESYTIPSCDSCWVQTTPGYLPALLPYWRNNSTLISGVKAVAKDYRTMSYDEDTSGLLYKEAYAVFQNGLETNPGFQIIAEYWDDGTGVSGTPSGHLFSIAQHLAQQERMPLTHQLRFYATLGVVLNDVVIACWELKYSHNFIRPITYIQRFIYPQFNSRIDTPSFPESPSGHSFHSGAAGAVFQTFFGDNLHFVDSTNANRTDIDGTPRAFSSVTELVEEISISRFYGGIHFQKTLTESVSFGEKLGYHILHELNREE